MKRGLDQLYQDLNDAKKTFLFELCAYICNKSLQRIVNKAPPNYQDWAQSVTICSAVNGTIGIRMEDIELYKKEDRTMWVVIDDARYEVKSEKILQVRNKKHKARLHPMEPFLMWYARQLQVKRLLEKLDETMNNPIECYKKLKQ